MARYLVTRYETYEYDAEAIKKEYPVELAEYEGDVDAFIKESVPELVGQRDVEKLVWLVEDNFDEDWEE